MKKILFIIILIVFLTNVHFVAANSNQHEIEFNKTGENTFQIISDYNYLNNKPYFCNELNNRYVCSYRTKSNLSSPFFQKSNEQEKYRRYCSSSEKKKHCLFFLALKYNSTELCPYNYLPEFNPIKSKCYYLILLNEEITKKNCINTSEKVDTFENINLENSFLGFCSIKLFNNKKIKDPCELFDDKKECYDSLFQKKNIRSTDLIRNLETPPDSNSEHIDSYFFTKGTTEHNPYYCLNISDQNLKSDCISRTYLQCEAKKNNICQYIDKTGQNYNWLVNHIRKGDCYAYNINKDCVNSNQIKGLDKLFVFENAIKGINWIYVFLGSGFLFLGLIIYSILSKKSVRKINSYVLFIFFTSGLLFNISKSLNFFWPAILNPFSVISLFLARHGLIFFIALIFAVLLIVFSIKLYLKKIKKYPYKIKKLNIKFMIIYICLLILQAIIFFVWSSMMSGIS